jgi:hypothetical protein
MVRLVVVIILLADVVVDDFLFWKRKSIHFGIVVGITPMISEQGYIDCQARV